jgi:hypothetical protein
MNEALGADVKRRVKVESLRELLVITIVVDCVLSRTISPLMAFCMSIDDGWIG